MQLALQTTRSSCSPPLSKSSLEVTPSSACFKHKASLQPPQLSRSSDFADGMIFGHCFLITTFTLQDLDAKARPAVLKSLLSFIQNFDPAQRRVFDLSAPADSLITLRALAEGCPGEVKWRAGRSWVVGESVEREESGV
jgi:hypothetical protein